MVESIAYGNRHQMIRFDVRIRQTLVDELVQDGYLDEDEFDLDEYINEDYDEWGVSPVAKPLMDAIIDWYENKVDEMDEKVEDATVRDEWHSNWETYTDLDKIVVLSDTGDNFYDYRHFGDVPLVEVKDVDPDDPYRS